MERKPNDIAINDVRVKPVERANTIAIEVSSGYGAGNVGTSNAHATIAAAAAASSDALAVRVPVVVWLLHGEM